MKEVIVALLALFPADSPSGGAVEIVETFEAPSLEQALYACHAYRLHAWRAWGPDEVLAMVCQQVQPVDKEGD